MKYQRLSRTAALSIGLVLTAALGAGCQNTAEPPAPPTQTVTDPTTPAAAPTETAAPTDPAPSTTGAEPTTDPGPVPTGFITIDLDALPPTIGEWELDRESGNYDRGEILDGTFEVVSVTRVDISYDDFVSIMTDPSEIDGGVCDLQGAASVCVGNTANHGVVQVQGQGEEQTLEIATAVLPTL